jgi:hypothetical protein
LGNQVVDQVRVIRIDSGVEDGHLHARSREAERVRSIATDETHALRQDRLHLCIEIQKFDFDVSRQGIDCRSLRPDSESAERAVSAFQLEAAMRERVQDTLLTRSNGSLTRLPRRRQIVTA